MQTTKMSASCEREQWRHTPVPAYVRMVALQFALISEALRSVSELCHSYGYVGHVHPFARHPFPFGTVGFHTRLGVFG